jgi:multicomponent Na+:H+ antiporter subunit B
MIARLFAIIAVIGMAVVIFPFLRDVAPTAELSPVAEGYVKGAPQELGAQNVVTAVVVTYRGLDTLGEVTVLFIATAGIGFLLRRSFAGDPSPGEPALRSDGEHCTQCPSEILASGARILIPIVLLFGVYIFVHGHLTPGGGFQGGVLIAAAALLHFLSTDRGKIAHGILTFVESLSGGTYVVIGILGLVLAAGFLDPRLLPIGRFGALLSAGAIPVIYSLVGLKVGAELTGILDRMRSEEAAQ